MAQSLISPLVRDYVESFVLPVPAELRAMDDYARENNFPIIGRAAGHLCYQVARMVGARRVFELGSGFGYSTAWFARAVQENGGGIVHHVVWDEELSQQAQRHLAVLGLVDVVRFRVGEAVQTLRESPGPFDLILCDIDKQRYPEALPVIKDRLRAGGVLIVDNMLWHARVFDESDREPSTEGVREMARQIAGDADWIASLVPVPDGVVVAYKR